MKVCKFGGTSVASAKQIQKVATIVRADSTRKVIVVSAPGKRFPEDCKTTDLLIELGETAYAGRSTEEAFQRVFNRYHDIAKALQIDALIMPIIEADLRRRLTYSKEDQTLFIDYMKAAGEDCHAKLITAYFNHIGIPARYTCPKEAGLYVTERPRRVQAIPEGYDQLKELGQSNDVIVFPGFFGFTKSGTLRTFNRGGSDITGSIIAAAIDAELYENFTDVDAVFTANPTVIDKPMAIKQMTYREMRELSYAGFSVFHDEALRPAFLKSIPVCIKNTNNPDAPGTMIVQQRDFSTQPVIGIAADSGFSTLFVEKYLMNQEIGFGRKLLQILEDEGISFEHTPSGIDNMSIIIRNQYLSEESRRNMIHRITNELHVDDVHFRNKNYSMIMLVGEGMRHSKGLTARAATAIARANANIEMINQGSSEVSLVFGIDQQDEQRVFQELYKEFFQSTAVLV